MARARPALGRLPGTTGEAGRQPSVSPPFDQARPAWVRSWSALSVRCREEEEGKALDESLVGVCKRSVMRSLQQPVGERNAAEAGLKFAISFVIHGPLPSFDAAQSLPQRAAPPGRSAPH